MSADRFTVHVETRPDVAAALLTKAAETLERGPFQSAGWLAAWAGAFRPDEGLTAACLLDPEGRPVFVLPLVRERRRGMTILSAPDCGFTDYNGPLVAAEFQPDPATFAKLWAGLVRALPASDLLAIEKSPARIGQVANPIARLIGSRPSPFHAHVLDLGAGFETVSQERFDGSFRRSLAKKRRKLAAKGVLAFDAVSGPKALACLEMVQGWRARRFGDELCPDALVRGCALYRALVTAGEAVVCRLMLDGQIIGGALGVPDRTGFRLLMVGHDETFKNWSPGMLAIESTIEWAAGAGLPLFDFTIGSERYKADFGVTPEPLVELVVPTSLKGVLYVAYRKTRTALHDLRHAPARQAGVGATPEAAAAERLFG